VNQPQLMWSRTLPVTESIYNSVAYIENPNKDIGSEAVAYEFEVYDDSNTLVATRTGRTFIEPNGITPVFEPSIEMEAGSEPSRTFFSYELIEPWVRTESKTSPFEVDRKKLSGVDDEPRLTARISNDSVRDYEDIQAVAVILNSNDNAIATSKTIIPELNADESSNVVYTWPQPLRKELEQCAAPSSVAVALDVSGSMNDDQQNPPQPLTDAKEAAGVFVNTLSQQDRAGLVTFATDASVVQQMSDQLSRATSAIDQLVIDPDEERGYTNMGAAIDLAHNELGAAQNPDQLKKAIVLLTDGKANVPEDPGGEEYARQQVAEAKQDNLSVYTIGLGSKVNADFLRSVASNPDQYYQAATSDQLKSIYQQISAAICERGPAVIQVLPRARSVFFPNEED
jgi:Mg-chelatase subunit ChlD